MSLRMDVTRVVPPPSAPPRPSVPFQTPFPPPIHPVVPIRERLPLETEQYRRRPAIAVFLLVTFVLTWGAYGGSWIFPPYIGVLLWCVGALGPTAGALAATGLVLRRGFPGIDLDPRVQQWRAYLLAIGVPIAVFAVAGGTTAILDGEPLGPGRDPGFPMGAVQFLLILALLEEIGWRGFLYPILARRGVLVAGVITGVIWGSWHIPWLIGEYHLGAFDIALFVLAGTLGSVSMCVLTKRTNSIGPATVAHTAWNLVVLSGFLLPRSEANVTFEATVLIALLIVAGVALFVDRQKSLRTQTHRPFARVGAAGAAAVTGAAVAALALGL